MRKAAFMALVIVATAVLAACSPGATPGLTDKEWQLTAITEKIPAFQGVIPAADQSKYTINFKTDLTFAANADCNVVGGTYKTPGSSALLIEVGISTMAFCPEESFSSLYIHALGRSKTYAIVNDVLTITLEDEGTLVFSPAAAAPSAGASAGTSAAAATAKPTAKPTTKPTTAPTAKPTTKPTTAPTAKPGATATPTPPPAASNGLLGKTWQLTTITEKNPAFQGVVPEAQQANYTVTFAADGTFQAKADCNSVAGTFTAADATAASGSLTITPGPTTTVACADGSLSDLYILGLSKAASYAVANGALTITLTDDGTLVYK